MYLACLATTALAVAGAVSAGGVTALIVKEIREWIDAQIVVEPRREETR